LMMLDTLERLQVLFAGGGGGVSFVCFEFPVYKVITRDVVQTLRDKGGGGWQLVVIVVVSFYAIKLLWGPLTESKQTPFSPKPKNLTSAISKPLSGWRKQWCTQSDCKRWGRCKGS